MGREADVDDVCAEDEGGRVRVGARVVLGGLVVVAPVVELSWLATVACLGRPNAPDSGRLLLVAVVAGTALDDERSVALADEPGAPLTGSRLGDTFRCVSSSLSASALGCRVDRVDRERVSPLNEDDIVNKSIVYAHLRVQPVPRPGSQMCSDVVTARQGARAVDSGLRLFAGRQRRLGRYRAACAWSVGAGGLHGRGSSGTSPNLV